MVRTVVCPFPRAAVTKYHKLSDLKEQKVIVSQFWKRKAQNHGISRAMRSLKPAEERMLPCPFLASGGGCHSLAVHGLQSHRSSLGFCLHKPWHSSCVSPSPLLIRTAVVLDYSPYFPSVTLHSLILSTMTRLLIRSHSEVLGGEDFNMSLEDTQFNP